MADPTSEAMVGLASAVPEHLISECGVGLILAGLTIAYIIFIDASDSIVEKRQVISINLSRFVLDGLTFATGCTVALVFVDPAIFSIVASNYIHATVTAFSCVIGPIINLAERYGRLLDR